MVMEPESTVVSEFEGTLLKDADLFPYFMLVAFEGSGLLRFTILLILWPLFRLLDFVGKRDFSRRMMVFVSMIGLKEADIQTVARAVLPKFYMDGLDMEAWRLFESYERRVIVTRFPTLMVGSFVKEHLKADDVIGCALEINRFGYATGFLCQEQEYCDSSSAEVEKVKRLLADGDRRPDVGMGRRSSAVISETSFLDFCLEQHHSPFATIGAQNQQLVRPLPVIFHDGRLVHLPTPWKALILILWIPIGIIAAAIRIVVGLLIPMRFIPYTLRVLGGEITIKGNPPPPSVPGRSGVLFVCTHRTLMDPVILSIVLARQIPAVTYSLSRLSEILSPIPTIRLSRDRLIDSYRIKMELAKGDLAICPEGTTCREPFLLRFSSLFAELTDRIVPVAMNYRVGFFHPTTASGWKALDPIFFFMNPRPIYEVTFLDQLPIEATCSGNRSSHDVANNVQRILAATLGFECTSLTRKDKYKVLAGNDGIVGASSSIIQLLSSFIHNKKD